MQVKWGLTAGATREKLAAALGICEDTLRKYYREELEFGDIKSNTQIAGRLFKKAMEGDTAALIFWAKTRMGWIDVNKHEHSGPNGAPMQMELRDLSTLTDEQLDALERAAAAFAGGTAGTGDAA